MGQDVRVEAQRMPPGRKRWPRGFCRHSGRRQRLASRLLLQGAEHTCQRVQLKPEAALGNTLAAIVTFPLCRVLQWFRHFPHF